MKSFDKIFFYCKDWVYCVVTVGRLLSVCVHLCRDLPDYDKRSDATRYVLRLIYRRGRVSGATICLYKC